MGLETLPSFSFLQPLLHHHLSWSVFLLLFFSSHCSPWIPDINYCETDVLSHARKPIRPTDRVYVCVGATFLNYFVFHNNKEGGSKVGKEQSSAAIHSTVTLTRNCTCVYDRCYWKKVHTRITNSKLIFLPPNPTHFLFLPPHCVALFFFFSHLHTKLSIFTVLSLGLAGWIVLQGKAASTSFRSDNIHGTHREQEFGHWAGFSFPSIESRRKQQGREGQNPSSTFIVLNDPAYAAVSPNLVPCLDL